MKNNKLVMALVLAVIGVTAFVISVSDKDGIGEDVPQATPTAQVSKAPAPVKTTSGTSAQQAQTYTDLVKQYEGRRIQFDIGCQAIPSNVTYKNGTKVMFDNRSGDARIITVDGVQYSLSGYGYKILTLSSNVLPKNLLISCGAAVNVGQILLQK